MHRILRSILAVALTVPFVLVGCPPTAGNNGNGTGSGGELDTETEFVISAIPDQEVAMIQRRGDGVAKYLKSVTGLNVRFQAVSDYDASVTSFVNGEIHMAWYGGLTGCQAREQVASTAIAQREVDAAFQSVFIVHTDSDITMNPDDAAGFRQQMQGKTLSFGSESSTSGRLMPQHFLQTLFGLEGPFNAGDSADPKIMFSGSHPKTAAMVAAGTADVGALNSGTWKRVKAGEVENVDGSKLKAIWTTPEYYDYNWTIRNDVDETFGAGCLEKVRAALVAIDGANDDADLAAIEASICEDYGAAKFIASKNENYAAIRDVAIGIGMLKAD